MINRALIRGIQFMPKYKRSKGLVTITTPFPEFVDYMRCELDNIVDWNKTTVNRTGQVYTGPTWRISIHNNSISVISKEPVVHLRHGIKIFMGDGRMVIS